MTFIRELLSDGGEHEAAECEAKLRDAGISSSTAKRAKRMLGVVSSKPHFAWFWQLPAEDGEA